MKWKLRLRRAEPSGRRRRGGRLFAVLAAALVAVLAMAGPAAAQGEEIHHTVWWGETLSEIAVVYGTDVDLILAANGLWNPHTIYAGQMLVIPAETRRDGDGAIHVVRWGETLSGIAQAYDTAMADLMDRNGLIDPNWITAGQVLRIPSGDGDTPLAIGGVEAPDRPVSQRIEVDISEQHLYAFEEERLVYSFVASSGTAGAATVPGSFQVLNKLPTAYSTQWAFTMPYWLGIYWAGSAQNGIHGYPVDAWGQELWSAYLGRPVTFGCVMLDTADAALLYDWVEVGTPVLIRR